MPLQKAITIHLSSQGAYSVDQNVGLKSRSTLKEDEHGVKGGHESEPRLNGHTLRDSWMREGDVFGRSRVNTEAGGTGINTAGWTWRPRSGCSHRRPLPSGRSSPPVVINKLGTSSNRAESSPWGLGAQNTETNTCLQPLSQVLLSDSPT